MTKAPYYMIAVLQAYAMAEPDLNESVTAELVRDGMIEKGYGDRWTATAKGQAYVRLLSEVPLPEQKWVDPRTAAVTR